MWRGVGSEVEKAVNDLGANVAECEGECEGEGKVASCLVIGSEVPLCLLYLRSRCL